VSDFWHSSLDVIEAFLTFLHDVFEPIFGVHSWGWAIIALTLIVRVFLLPLAIKQTRSMRAMQAIQPEMKALQKKYKVDRELMRKDPEQYRAKKAKLNEEMMALYKERGANPAASCLPLLAQAPVFLALFWTLRRMRDEGGELVGASFYFFTEFGPEDVEPGLQMLVNEASWPGWLLILLMSGTMYWTQRQMMARTAMTQGESNPMAQQQKILLYAMPIFLAVISFQFPLGILLYWVTTNVWQVAQQAIILREVKAEAESGELKRKLEGDDAPEPPKRRSPGASSGTKPVPKEPRSDKDQGKGSGKGSGQAAAAAPGKSSGKGSGKSSGKGQQTSGKSNAGAKKAKDGSKKDQAVKNENRNQQRSKDGDRAAKGGAGSSNGQKPRAGGSSNGSTPGEKPPRRSKRDHLPRRPRS
jgi:YidC/Oxa1 family membrane protein insertase